MALSDPLSLDQIQTYLELVELEQDESMADWARSILVESETISDAQVEWLRSSPLLARHPKNRFFLERNYLFRRLREPSLTDPDIEACLGSRDKVVLSGLADHPGVPVSVRERAKVLLQEVKHMGPSNPW